jgi:hypothetical protein
MAVEVTQVWMGIVDGPEGPAGGHAKPAVSCALLGAHWLVPWAYPGDRRGGLSSSGAPIHPGDSSEMASLRCDLDDRIALPGMQSSAANVTAACARGSSAPTTGLEASIPYPSARSVRHYCLSISAHSGAAQHCPLRIDGAV